VICRWQKQFAVDDRDKLHLNLCIMKTIWLIFGCFLLVAVDGCKPKETTLSGQVFIVTKGAENFKLGDVQVFLIEKSQVTNYLQKRQPAIESEMATKRQDIKNAEQEFAIAQTNANKAQDYFDWFTENKPYKTNAAYFKADSEWTKLFKQYVRQTNYVNQLAKDDPNGAFLPAIEVMEEMVKKLNSLTDQMRPIKTAALVAEKHKLELAKLSVTKANSHIDAARKTLDDSPNVTDYFGDFFPHDLTIVKKTISDSDGKFSLFYPNEKPFSIFVRAQRAVLDKTETYCWLIDAPTGVNTAQVLLSNNNLAIVDPDGYFKLKPKEAHQVLAK